MINGTAKKYSLFVCLVLLILLCGCTKSDNYVLSELRYLFLDSGVIKSSAGNGTVVIRVNHTSSFLSMIVSYPVKDIEMTNLVPSFLGSKSDIEIMKKGWIDSYCDRFENDLNFLKGDDIVVYSIENPRNYPVVFVKKDTAYIIVSSFNVDSREKPWKAGTIKHKP